MKHKFRCGDLVRIEVSPSKTWMSHFDTGMIARLGYSYADRYGGKERGDDKKFSIHIPGNQLSWYDIEDFILLEKGSDKDAFECMKGNFKWRSCDANLAKVYSK